MLMALTITPSTMVVSRGAFAAIWVPPLQLRRSCGGWCWVCVQRDRWLFSLLLVEMDSSVVCSMVLLHQTHCLWLRPLLQEAIQLVYATDRACQLRHVYRKSNHSAYFLASMGHGTSFQPTVFEWARSSLQCFLYEDMRGVALPITVLQFYSCFSFPLYQYIYIYFIFFFAIFLFHNLFCIELYYIILKRLNRIEK